MGMHAINYDSYHTDSIQNVDCYEGHGFKVQLKGALDKYNIILNFFQKKVGIFIQLEVLAWVMTAC